MLGAGVHHVDLLALGPETATGNHSLGAVHRVSPPFGHRVADHAEAPTRLDGEGAEWLGSHRLETLAVVSSSSRGTSSSHRSTSSPPNWSPLVAPAIIRSLILDLGRVSSGSDPLFRDVTMQQLKREHFAPFVVSDLHGAMWVSLPGGADVLVLVQNVAPHQEISEKNEGI